MPYKAPGYLLLNMSIIADDLSDLHEIHFKKNRLA
jgi:hypothetical protein